MASGLAIAALILFLWPGSTGNGIALDAPETAAGPPGTELRAGSFAAAVRASAPAVVSIYTRRVERLPPAVPQQQFGGRMSPGYRERVQQSLGSGVIVDGSGHIVTNQHVIGTADQISVQLGDGRQAEASVVGRDLDTDIAVLKIDMADLPVMQLGRADRVAVGDVVLAIGNPLGLAQTVTHGIVSATGRAQLGVSVYEDFIQTDAAINVGNSGGALVNTRGELIGINTAVLGKDLGAEGIGVAIPVDLVRGVMQEILRHGRVVRGWIGIIPEDIPAEYVRALGLPHAGVVIANLYRDSPALAGGLAIGDMLEAIDGQPVLSAQDTLARIAGRRPGTTLTIAVARAQRRFTLQLTVTEAPARAPP
ncbi:MAG: trypsin-like peptidase domain-containing protein [Steroidobacteraceae bacterium]